MATRDDTREVGPPAAIFLRPIGSPLALGLAGLVAASLVASGLELGWLASTDRHQAALVFLAFAFPLQFAASMLAYASRDGAVGAAMGVLAGTWLTTALVYLVSVPGTRSDTLGLFLLASAGLLSAAATAAATGKLVPAAVFYAEAARFAAIGIYELGGGRFWQDLGGVIGLVVVVLAGYAVLATALEDAQDRRVLPLGRRGRGHDALAAPLESQYGGLEHEAGVRKQL